MAVTVKDENLHHATEALILKSPRKYYRVPIFASHWQLRSIISTPSPNILLYSARQGICQLDTNACEKEIVSCVPFTPRCLVAAEGWICCGGEAGDFATIHLEPRDPAGTGIEADTQSRLFPDLDASQRSIDRMTHGLPSKSIKTSLKSTKVGLEIVNCVTLWFPKPDLKDQTYEKPVAVLSNNDRSVAIVDLERSEVLETLKLDDCVNRAVISPNGRLLIAIGDDPYMHVYQRKELMGIHKGPVGSKSFKSEWVKCQRVQLHGQRISDKSDMRGSFAAAFSPSGRYLAIGTQYGIISVFQASILPMPDEDPLLVTFTTSRPNQKAGAVRTLEFSPEPHDLLAWTENNGRAGVADIRRRFMSRQVLIMDPDAEGVDRLPLLERPSDILIDPRLRHSQTDSDSYSSDSLTAHHLLELERMLQSSLHREGLGPFEAIQVERRQRERDTARPANSSTAQNSSSSTGSSDDTRPNILRENAGSRRYQTSAIPNSLREFISSRATESLRNESVRVYFSDRGQERERRVQEPRRRGSVILAAAQSALDDESTDSQRNAGGDAGTESNRSTLTPFRLPPIGTDSPHNPWADIEALYNLAGALPPVESSTRARSELDADNRRDYSRRLELHRLPFTSRIDHDEETNRARTLHSPDLGFSIFSDPLDTTGCCWSQDGKTLYIGAENGIYEYHVNTFGRKFFPSLVLQ